VIRAHTFADDGRTPLETARVLAEFLAGARRSLDVAIYHFELGHESSAVLSDAFRDASARGVRVRIAYNLHFPNPIPVPPPPTDDDDLILSLGVPSMSISGDPDLMHHKFVVRDRTAVWTGSMNWTDDSWSRQENAIVVVESEPLAHAYTLAFDQLWETRDVGRSGKVEPRPVEVGESVVRPWFSPEYGDDRSHRIAKYIGRARERVRVASPVITAGPVLGTLAEICSEGRIDVRGVVDLTQMLDVRRQWIAEGGSSWKLPLLETVLRCASFAGKPSIPWRPESVHNFMHAKVVVADDVVFVGSFNLSRSGETNAEDVLEIHDAPLADELAVFVEAVADRYPRAELPPAAMPPEGAQAPLNSR
jgi:phosphatidylserine/phosphatidylglycerophosphate/cardiolipin synthase-like enzyme